MSARNNWLVTVGATLLLLIIIGQHSLKFRQPYFESYRQDEAWAVHNAIVRDARGMVAWSAINVHPPGWRLSINAWVDAFGHHERITRYASTLWTVLGLACLFRLGTDLLDRRTALMAVILLGFLPIFSYYSHETRPYAALTALTSASYLFFWRWLVIGKRVYTWAYVLTGITMVYMHLFGVYVILAQAVMLPIIARWDALRYLRAFGLFAAVGLAFTLGWGLPGLHTILVARPGGIAHGTETTLRNIIDVMTFHFSTSPVGLGVVLGLAAPFIALPPAAAAPLRSHARKRFLLAAVMAPLVLAWIVNIQIIHVTARNLMIVLPPMAILAAAVLRVSPAPLTLAILAMISLQAFTDYDAYGSTRHHGENAQFLAVHAQPEDYYFIENRFSATIVDAYYVRERLPFAVTNASIFYHFGRTTNFDVRNNAAGVFKLLPGAPPHYAVDADNPEHADRLRAFLGEDVQRLWYLGPTNLSGTNAGFRALILDDYRLHVSTALSDSSIDEYLRVPAAFDEVLRFGEHLVMGAWRAATPLTVAPCGTLSIDTWWRTEAPLDDNYSMQVAVLRPGEPPIAQSNTGLSRVLTLLWALDEPYPDPRNLTIPCGTPPGEYSVFINVYDPDTLTALPARTPDGATYDQLAFLTTITVQAADAP